MNNKRQLYILLAVILMLSFGYFEIYRRGLFFSQALVVSNHMPQAVERIELLVGDTLIQHDGIVTNDEALVPFESNDSTLIVKIVVKEGMTFTVDCGYTTKGMSHAIKLDGSMHPVCISTTF